MKQIVAVIFFLQLISLVSCVKKCPCFSHRILLNYISFQTEETDTIIVRRFRTGTNFTGFVDSSIIHRLNSSYIYHTDTLTIWDTNGDSTSIKNGYDFELFLPGANKTNRIHDIREEYTEANCLNRNLNGCFNPLISIKVDGQIYPVDLENPNVYFRH